MKKNDVLRAAKLIEQLAKVDAFLKAAPIDANSLTFTLRNGKKTKSLSLTNDGTIVTVYELIYKVRSDMITELNELKVDRK